MLLMTFSRKNVDRIGPTEKGRPCMFVYCLEVPFLIPLIHSSINFCNFDIVTFYLSEAMFESLKLRFIGTYCNFQATWNHCTASMN
jgi:hypothetical protein